MSNCRIVITGMGAVSPLGCGIEAIWQRLLKGESGIRALPDEIVADLPVKVGGQVPALAQDAEAGFNLSTRAGRVRRCWPARLAT
ncbi:beta-ketoacyl synthase N-terminal-like domain-containing protein, partial [Serratia bockelmannii]|nr:beta-ketoacyl synthase N-terminal-like domain-containing protein [Serratia bockelmannii]